jgi:hypothetical protein
MINDRHQKYARLSQTLMTQDKNLPGFKSRLNAQAGYIRAGTHHTQAKTSDVGVLKKLSLAGLGIAD